MPTDSEEVDEATWFIKVAHVAPIISLGIGLHIIAGCSPTEAGSVKLPAELRRGTKPGHGPGAAKAGMRPLGPGQFRVEPKTKLGRRRIR